MLFRSKLDNIPAGLEVYKPYIQNSEKVNWLSWQIKGKTFLDIADSCPFCSTQDISTKKQIIEKVSKEYEPKYVEHLEKVLKLLSSLENFLTEAAQRNILEIKKNVDGISDEQTTFLVNINSQIETLKGKLEKLNSLGSYQFREAHNISTILDEYKIDLSFLPDLASSKTTAQINKINLSIDELIKIGRAHV